jgi:hypothetical protein
MKDGGWSTPTAENLVTGEPFLAAVFDANSAQIPLSLLYVSTNAILTEWVANSDYISYATKHQPLHVKKPSGGQKSTYYLLGLPWYAAAILLAGSTILHWLGSQAFFAVFIYQFASDGVQVENDQTDLDWTLSGIRLSTQASLAIIAFGSVIILTVLALGFRRFPASNIPLRATCSATLSAACHPHWLDVDVSSKPVRWGEVDVEAERDHAGESAEGAVESMRHLTFTSLRTREPEVGVLYA